MARKSRRQIKAIKAQHKGRHRSFDSLSHEIAQNQDIPLANAKAIVGAIKRKQIARFGSHIEHGHVFVNR